VSEAEPARGGLEQAKQHLGEAVRAVTAGLLEVLAAIPIEDLTESGVLEELAAGLRALSDARRRLGP